MMANAMTMGLSKGDLLEGRYRIFHRIGEGGMGVVYAAEHVALHRKCAIKVLHPSEAGDQTMIARFRIEAQAAANIRHMNIVEVTDFGITPDNRPFFVMEFLEGESLAEQLDRVGRLTERKALHITKQILEGLMAAHRMRVVHRDLKPENIFLAVQGDGKKIVKILDFGISKIVAGTPSRPPAPISGKHQALTQKGVVFGTPGYMAPETLFGTEIVDNRADLFSVAVLLFEMLAGKRPFHGPDPQATMIATASKSAPSIRSFRPELSYQLDDVICNGLAKDPKYRYQSAKAFFDAIISLDKPKSKSARTPTRREAPLPPRVPEKIELEHVEPTRTKSVEAAPPYPTYQQPLTKRRRNSSVRRLSFALSPITILFLMAVVGLGIYFFGIQKPVHTVSEEDPVDAKIATKVQNSLANSTVTGEPIETVTIRLKATPSDLQVMLRDKLIFERPLILPKSLESMSFRFFKEGYKDETRDIVPDQDQIIIVKLKKIREKKRRRKKK